MVKNIVLVLQPIRFLHSAASDTPLFELFVFSKFFSFFRKKKRKSEKQKQKTKYFFFFLSSKRSSWRSNRSVWLFFFNELSRNRKKITGCRVMRQTMQSSKTKKPRSNRFLFFCHSRAVFILWNRNVNIITCWTTQTNVLMISSIDYRFDHAWPMPVNIWMKFEWRFSTFFFIPFSSRSLFLTTTYDIWTLVKSGIFFKSKTSLFFRRRRRRRKNGFCFSLVLNRRFVTVDNVLKFDREHLNSSLDKLNRENTENFISFSFTQWKTNVTLPEKKYVLYNVFVVSMTHPVLLLFCSLLQFHHPSNWVAETKIDFLFFNVFSFYV